MLQFNIHNDQGAAKSCNFKVDAKYPAESSNFYEDKKSPVEIDRLLKISFQFLSSGPSFSFLSDPSPILVYPCHWLIPWLTDSLTHSCFSELDWCDPGVWRWQLKTYWSAAVVEVDDEKHADNGLVQIWKINFGHKVKLLFSLFEILKLMFRQDFEVVLQIWSRKQMENNGCMPHES